MASATTTSSGVSAPLTSATPIPKSSRRSPNRPSDSRTLLPSRRRTSRTFRLPKNSTGASPGIVAEESAAAFDRRRSDRERDQDRARIHAPSRRSSPFTHGYHGRTLLALSMTGKNAPYKQHFGPFCSEIYHAPFPYEHHGMDSRASAGGARRSSSKASSRPTASLRSSSSRSSAKAVSSPRRTHFCTELREIARPSTASC